MGAAVHTGIATVGNVGTDDASDSTAVGDAVNTAARLAASAAPGELLVSASAATAAALDTGGVERRTLSLRGREAAVDAWVETSRSPGASPARTGVG